MNNNFLAHCESAEYECWEVKNYFVEYSGSPLTNVGEYRCSCKAWTYAKTRPCKHIKEIIKNKIHCAWTGSAEELSAELKCPKCGKEAALHRRSA